MLLLLLGCAVRATAFQHVAAGAVPGEFYTVVAVSTNRTDVYGRTSHTIDTLTLLRCIDEQMPVGWYVTCHPVLTSDEAARAAEQDYASSFAHRQNAVPTKPIQVEILVPPPK